MDKAADLKLIADNWSVLLPAAERAFEEHGRGMLLVDTTRIESGGYPFQYVRVRYFSFSRSLRILSSSWRRAGSDLG